MFTFQSCKILNDKIDQNINFAKLPSAKYIVFFGTTVDFVIQKLNFCRIEKEDTCQLEIDHVTQQPKETCQRICRGPITVVIYNIDFRELIT